MASGKPISRKWMGHPRARLICVLGFALAAFTVWVTLGNPGPAAIEVQAVEWADDGLMVNVTVHNSSKSELIYNTSAVRVTSDRDPHFEHVYSWTRYLHRIKPGAEDHSKLLIPYRPLPAQLRLHFTRYREITWWDRFLNWLSDQAPSLSARRWILSKIMPTGVQMHSAPFDPPPLR